MLRISNLNIGIDIENIDRFKKNDFYQKSSFYKKIFSDKELTYCFSKKKPVLHLASRYAAKEAIIKASSGIIDKFDFDYKKIEILNNKKGAPFVNLVSLDSNKYKIKVSLSHCEDKATAVAIVMELIN